MMDCSAEKCRFVHIRGCGWFALSALQCIRMTSNFLQSNYKFDVILKSFLSGVEQVLHLIIYLPKKLAKSFLPKAKSKTQHKRVVST